MPEKDRDKRNRIIQERIPYIGMREVIGKRMRQSLDVAPQGSMMTRADANKIIKFREKLKTDGYKVSILDVFIKIASCAMREVPIINAAFIEADKEIHVYNTVNVGIPVRVENGIIVP